MLLPWLLDAACWSACFLLRASGAPDGLGRVMGVVAVLLEGTGLWLTSRAPDVRSRARMLVDALAGATAALVVAAEVIDHVSASIGVALTSPTRSVDEVLHLTDVAMYAAKVAGKGRVHVDGREAQPTHIG